MKIRIYLCGLCGEANERIRDLSRAAASVRTSAEIQSSGSRLCFGDQGQTLVELALLLPIMMMLLTGILSVGLAYSNQQALTQATGIAAQNLSQSRTTSTNPCAEVSAAIKSAAPQLSTAKLGLTLTMNGNNATGASCAGSNSYLVTAGGAGGTITVAATYPCQIGVLGVSFSSSCELQATVTEYEY